VSRVRQQRHGIRLESIDDLDHDEAGVERDSECERTAEIRSAVAVMVIVV
jgi:uncharacterized DUF497 family protein